MKTPHLWIKTALFTVLVPGSVMVLIPCLFGAYSGGARWSVLGALGTAAIASGALVSLRCAYDFVASGKGTPAPTAAPVYLVTNNLYRWIRNPMYAGVLLVLLGEAALFRTAVLLTYCAALAAGFHLFVILYEEPHLASIFGQSYREYCARVPRWLPTRIP